MPHLTTVIPVHGHQNNILGLFHPPKAIDQPTHQPSTRTVSHYTPTHESDAYQIEKRRTVGLLAPGTEWIGFSQPKSRLMPEKGGGASLSAPLKASRRPYGVDSLGAVHAQATQTPNHRPPKSRPNNARPSSSTTQHSSPRSL